MNLRTIRTGAAAAALLAVTALSAQADATLRMAYDEDWGGAENLDPISPTRHYMVNNILYSRLMREGEDGSPVPELATAWQASPDAMEWTR